jgi:polyisoprenoid-binding protein YceI
MKTIYLTLIAALGLSLGIKAQDINTSESSLKWYGNEISGKQHYGGLTFKSGSINTSNGKLTGGAFEIDMTSIDVQDLEGEWAEKLEGHLKADDFFGVDNFASAYLVLTSVKESANGSFAATGDLTIRGITNPVDVTFTAAGSNKMTAQMTFDRSKYDVKFRSGAFFSDLGDKLILDDIKVEVSLVY